MPNELPAGVRAQLIKIKSLADAGVEGERQNAARLLLALCEKHGVAPETLVSEERKRYRIAYKDVREFELLKQCYYHICRKARIEFWHPRKAVEVEMTEAEAIDLRAAFNYYRKLWAVAEEEFYDAFVAKHKIYGPPSDSKDEDPEPMDPAKLARLIAMIRGMDGHQSWQRPTAKLNA
jgi:hypothetical protein